MLQATRYPSFPQEKPRPLLTTSPDPTKNIQIRRPTLRPRLPRPPPRRAIRPCLWERQRKSHHARNRRLAHRHRRNRPPTPRRPKDQTTNEPRSLPRPRCIPDSRRRRHGSIPRRRLDRCSKCSWIIRTFWWIGCCEAVSFQVGGL